MTAILRISISLVILLYTLNIFASSADTLRAESDMQVIRARMLDTYNSIPDLNMIQHLRVQMGVDGSWQDINYTDTSTTSWLPAGHLKRLLILTQAWFASVSPLYHDKKLLSEISCALDFWLHLDPRRPWWWDSIGAPGTLGWILLMLDENLTEYQRSQGIRILERAKLGSTGQNLVWQAEITIRRALLQRDKELLTKAFELITSEIKISAGEGIQSDYSFHQHGPCLYNHGYGAGFIEYNARLASLTAGTIFEYTPEKLALLSSYILDGSQWLALGPVSDFAAEGRELTRPDENARYLGEASKYMLTLPTGREKEFKALCACIDGQTTDPLTGNKHFFRSDIMVHHRPGWYMSVKMYSERTVNTDGLSGCDEGLLSHYLAEGATTIMRHGKEYKNIFPVWDWQSIPGTTVELKTHIPGEPKRKGINAFAGGASNGTIGVAGFHLSRDFLTARKAWFFFSDMAVCLGTDIHCMTNNPVVTTLNQSISSGPVVIGHEKGTEILNEDKRVIHSKWIFHDGIAYVPNKSTEMEITNMVRTGNWQRISAQKSNNPVTEKIFMLRLNHGQRPEIASYAYAVIPDITEKDIEGTLKKSPYSIIMNSRNLQAVFHHGDESLGIVFHEAGKLKWKNWQIESDRPCILLISHQKEDWTMAVADPTSKSGKIILKIKIPRKAFQEVEVNLPEGLYAGASKLIILE